MTTWYDRLPKIELHMHLEGAIPYDCLWDLVNKYGGAPSVPDWRALERRFVFRDFPHFLEMWRWKNGFLRAYEDFEYIAEAVARDLARQNIRYAEVFYSPPDFHAFGLETQRLTAAIRSGLDQVPETIVALVADLVRNSSPADAAITLEQINEVQDQGVIGIGIGGAEQLHPPEPFAEIYARARRLGLHTTAHAGEAAGAESMWGAIRALEVERIGHGTRAAEDPALIEYLAEHQIPLEMCPLSNVRTGVVRTIQDHPVRRYYEQGLAVTVNTDDPKMFGNSLAQEYCLLVEQLGFTPAEIRDLILQGIRASWLSGEDKERLQAEFCADPAWQEET